MTNSSSRWDFGRFFQTLSFFGSIPILSQLNTLMVGSNAPLPPQPIDNTLIKFVDGDTDATQIWGSLDDVVMGGVSQSLAKSSDEGLVFMGTVSTNNSGGFASIRTRNFDPSLDLSQYQGLSLRLKGDGQRYKFFIRDSSGWDTMAYAISFDTEAGKWMTVQLPFANMLPVMRAKTVKSAPALNQKQIASLQIMLSKFEYDRQLNPRFSPGTFALTIESIGVY